MTGTAPLLVARLMAEASAVARIYNSAVTRPLAEAILALEQYYKTPIPPTAMALFDTGHRLNLPNGYWLEKRGDDLWHIGGPMGGTPNVYLAMTITGSVPVGPGGSMDTSIKEFAEGISNAGQAK